MEPETTEPVPAATAAPKVDRSGPCGGYKCNCAAFDKLEKLSNGWITCSCKHSQGVHQNEMPVTVGK